MKIIKNFLLLGLLTLSIVSAAISCGDEKDEDLIGNWVERFDLGGDARSEAVAFSIGNIGYVGTGYNGEDRLSDFWSYDTETDEWTYMCDLPGGAAARTGAVAFSAAGKGFVGTGWDGNDKLGDFWAYDPELNKWDSVDAPDGPSARYAAVAFSIDDIGYVGTGYDGSTLLDFKAYNPASNTWSPIASYPSKVREAVAFVINGKGYVCTGEKNGEHINDFYMYDPAIDTWMVKRKISDVSDESYDDKYSILRKKAVALVIGGKAYVATGDRNSTLQNDTWEYDPGTDTWTERSNIEGSTRKDAVAFSTVNGRGFYSAGVSGGTAYFDDLREFKPTEVFDEED